MLDTIPRAIALGSQARQSARDDATIPSGLRRVGTSVVVDAAADRVGGRPTWGRGRVTQDVVVVVEDVDVGLGREVGVDREPHHPAVPVVVDVHAEIREQRGCRVRQTRIAKDLAVLLRYEDGPTRGEGDGHRVVESGEHRLVGIARVHGRRRVGRYRRDRERRGGGDDEERSEDAPTADGRWHWFGRARKDQSWMMTFVPSRTGPSAVNGLDDAFGARGNRYPHGSV